METNKKKERIDEILAKVEHMPPDQLMKKSARLMVLTLELPEACWLGLELAELSTGISPNQFMSDIVTHVLGQMNNIAIMDVLSRKLK